MTWRTVYARPCSEGAAGFLSAGGVFCLCAALEPDERGELCPPQVRYPTRPPHVPSQSPAHPSHPLTPPHAPSGAP